MTQEQIKRYFTPWKGEHKQFYYKNKDKIVKWEVHLDWNSGERKFIYSLENKEIITFNDTF